MASVDWKNLRHARGSAAQVPQLILDLAQPGHPSDAASFHLTEALVVAGTWLPTSVPAADQLLELLTRTDSKPVPRALRLLADLASAGHLWFFTPAAPARRKQDAVGQATLALTQRVLPLARTWLTSPEAELRAAAIFFLSLVEEDAASAAAIAELARTETTPELRGGAALALGLYARAGNEASKQLLGELNGDRYVQAGAWAGRVIAGLPCSEQETTAGVGAWFTDWRPSLLPWGYAATRGGDGGGAARAKLRRARASVGSKHRGKPVRFSWALAIASGEDAWAAHSALLALGAAPRRSSALAPLVVSPARSALAREDARSLAAAAVQVHGAKEHLDAQTRGRALACLVVAGVEARQAWLADRSHGRPDLDSAINDATLQR